MEEEKDNVEEGEGGVLNELADTETSENLKN